MARVHGGLVIPEQPPKGEHASNGVVEEAGKTSGGRARERDGGVHVALGESPDPVWKSKFRSAPIRGKPGPFRRRFLDARRGETKGVRLVREVSQLVATRKR